VKSNLQGFIQATRSGTALEIKWLDDRGSISNRAGIFQ